ncbi:MAG TPA: DegT/DnrJ/EryC1/StrS family aminotransferase, partial [Caldilineaceae bacterium]|nr:DegT/DnrJ/EryC1/StrS family aminotransferase [Caldilineaceae bacterium]
NLQDWANAHTIQLPCIPAHCEQSYHMFYLLLPSLQVRQELIRYLKERDIYAVFHYLPLHRSKMGQQLGGNEVDCPVTQDVSDRLLRLPFHRHLGEAELERVVAALQSFTP